jgi:hypothetical protein
VSSSILHYVLELQIEAHGIYARLSTRVKMARPMKQKDTTRLVIMNRYIYIHSFMYSVYGYMYMYIFRYGCMQDG